MSLHKPKCILSTFCSFLHAKKNQIIPWSMKPDYSFSYNSLEIFVKWGCWFSTTAGLRFVCELLILFLRVQKNEKVWGKASHSMHTEQTQRNLCYYDMPKGYVHCCLIWRRKMLNSEILNYCIAIKEVFTFLFLHFLFHVCSEILHHLNVVYVHWLERLRPLSDSFWNLECPG